MEVRCDACGKVHQFDEASFGRREVVAFKCRGCGQTLSIVNPKPRELRVETTHKKVTALSEEISPEGRVLRLPEDQELRLEVLEGEDRGSVYLLTKPRTLLGRLNADIVIEDVLASRLHCALEVGEDGVMLRDLGSTNGTLVNDRPIEMEILASGSTFRVGEHVFQLAINPKPV